MRDKEAIIREIEVTLNTMHNLEALYGYISEKDYHYLNGRMEALTWVLDKDVI